jgi:hypothetical protein
MRSHPCLIHAHQFTRACSTAEPAHHHHLPNRPPTYLRRRPPTIVCPTTHALPPPTPPATEGLGHHQSPMPPVHASPHRGLGVSPDSSRCQVRLPQLWPPPGVSPSTPAITGSVSLTPVIEDHCTPFGAPIPPPTSVAQSLSPTVQCLVPLR